MEQEHDAFQVPEITKHTPRQELEVLLPVSENDPMIYQITREDFVLAALVPRVARKRSPRPRN